MIKTLRWTLSLALLLAFASVGLAGGEKCAEKSKEHREKMAAEYKQRGWLGIETEQTADGRYAVAAVEAGSPAAAAGFRTGDVLLAMNGADLYAEDKTALKKAKSALRPGSEVRYTVERAGEKAWLTATLAPVPEAVLARWLDDHSHPAAGERTAEMRPSGN